jgi:magnesium-transporting ATPase (P-type)
MENPPRSEHAHLVGPQMMIISYMTIGMFETIAAYVVFFKVFKDDGFTFNMLLGAGPDWRSNYEDMSSERKEFFDELCLKNDEYLATGGNCQDKDDFTDYRIDTLNTAQGAFFIAVVWGQIANILIRKTQLATIFTWDRMFNNKYMIYSILLEIFLAFFLVYVPGLNTVFQFVGPEAEYVFYCIWIIPVIIIWDETRKWLIRTYPDSFIREYFHF